MDGRTDPRGRPDRDSCPRSGSWEGRAEGTWARKVRHGHPSVSERLEKVVLSTSGGRLQPGDRWGQQEAVGSPLSGAWGYGRDALL